MMEIIFNGDGWSSMWIKEPGFICDGQPSNWIFISKLEGAAATIGKTTMYTIIANVIVSIITSLCIEGSSMSFYATLNILQLLHFVPMMTLFYPQVLLSMFSYISLVNMNNWMLMALFSLTIDKDQISSKTPLDYRFENQSFESTNIFMNSGDTFMFICFWIINIIIIYILCLIFKPTTYDQDSRKKIKVFSINYIKMHINDLKNGIFFNFFIRFGYEAYLGLGLSWVLNIFNPSSNTFTEIESIIVAWIWAFFLIALLLLTLWITLWIKAQLLHK